MHTFEQQKSIFEQKQQNISNDTKQLENKNDPNISTNNTFSTISHQYDEAHTSDDSYTREITKILVSIIINVVWIKITSTFKKIF